MMAVTELLVVGGSAVVTALIVNFIISVRRRHEERHCTSVGVREVLEDAADVSMSVRRLTKQLGGRA